MSGTTTAKAKKSISLSAEQLQELENRIAEKELTGGTKTDAAISLGVSREILERIRTYKSCSEKTYKKLFPGAQVVQT